VLDVIDDEQLMANAATVGGLLRTELTTMTNGHPRIGEVRGAGLYIVGPWVLSGCSFIGNSLGKGDEFECCTALLKQRTVVKL
jgi:hypothetical protein